MDVLPLDYTQAGNPKLHFTLVDKYGTYILCVAMVHHTQSVAIKELQEVVIFYATGRKPIGRDPGMMYLMKEALVVPIGAPRTLSASKSQMLEVV